MQTREQERGGRALEAEIPELAESWFDKPKSAVSSRPPPRSTARPPMPSEPPIGDDLADAWFR